MFERFTDRARRAVVLAQDASRMLRHHYIGTEHLLYGLVETEGGIASDVLEGFGIYREVVLQGIESRVGWGVTAPSGHIPFTPRAKEVLELSLREALQVGHNYIGTEHILLGLIREGEGVGAQIIEDAGGSLEELRQAVLKALRGPETPKKADPVQEDDLKLRVRVRELQGRQGGTESYELRPADYEYSLRDIEYWRVSDRSIVIKFNDGSQVVQFDVEEVLAEG